MSRSQQRAAPVADGDDVEADTGPLEALERELAHGSTSTSSSTSA
jgi:hypothetical protein